MTDQTKPDPRRANPLYKDPVDKKIGGVASGVAHYFDIDTTLVRVVWAISVLIGGFGLLLYLVLWFILEDDPTRLESQPLGVARPLESEDAIDNPIDGQDHQTG